MEKFIDEKRLAGLRHLLYLICLILASNRNIYVCIQEREGVTALEIARSHVGEIGNDSVKHTCQTE